MGGVLKHAALDPEAHFVESAPHGGCSNYIVKQSLRLNFGSVCRPIHNSSGNKWSMQPVNRRWLKPKSAQLVGALPLRRVPLAVMRYPWLLADADHAAKADRQVVLAVVSQDGLLIRHA